eukprot:357011-Chlamydomonas_euryale.AAC.1
MYGGEGRVEGQAAGEEGRRPATGVEGKGGGEGQTTGGEHQVPMCIACRRAAFHANSSWLWESESVGFLVSANMRCARTRSPGHLTARTFNLEAGSESKGLRHVRAEVRTQARSAHTGTQCAHRHAVGCMHPRAF